MKIRHIKLAKSNGNGNGAGRHLNTASPLERRLNAVEEQLYELAKAIPALLDDLNKQLDFILDQQAEANLRMMFVMQFHKFKKQSAIIGGDGAAQVQTLYDIYLDSRDAFKAQLEAQIDAEREAIAKEQAARGILEPADPSAREPHPGDTVTSAEGTTVVAPGPDRVS